jgi:site-specific recombinase XerD
MTANSDVLLIRQNEAAEVAIQIVLDSLSSSHSKRAYERHIREFIAWHQSSRQTAFNKAAVQRYAAELRECGISASTINQRLSAIRKLAQELADNGGLDAQVAIGIRVVKGMRQEGIRSGNWLNKEEAQLLLNAPDTNTTKGARDRAILAFLIGCGLRRAEVVNLTFDRCQQRDGRWVLVDIVGKRNKIRSVPIPAWAKGVLDVYADKSGVTDGIIFRRITKGSRIVGERMTEQAIYNVVGEYAASQGLGKLAPHDLRRTFAKLAHKGGAGLDQIQLSLGHGSIQTTERYLGVEQDLIDAPCDHLGLRL